MAVSEESIAGFCQGFLYDLEAEKIGMVQTPLSHTSSRGWIKILPSMQGLEPSWLSHREAHPLPWVWEPYLFMMCFLVSPLLGSFLIQDS